MTPNFFRLWGTFIGLAGTGLFVWQIIKGLRSGVTRIPVSIFSNDEYVRGGGMFGFAIAMNMIGAIFASAIAYAIWSGFL